MTSAKRWGALVATLLCATLIAGCGDLGAPDSVTEQGKSFTSTWRVFLIGAIAVTLLIWVLVVMAVVRFRRRSDDMPNQRQYNIPFELGYTAVPVVIVAALFALTIYAENQFTSIAEEPSLEVEVIGFQWGWQFTYVDQGVTVTSSDAEPATLMLPVGETVRFHLVTRDVVHSFWVPEFLEKRDLIPQVDNRIDVEMTEAGEWTGRCAEYCGLDHWKMQFGVRAVPGPEFEEWLEEARQQPQPIVAGAGNAQSSSGGGS